MKKLLFIAISVFVINLLRSGRPKKSTRPGLPIPESNVPPNSADSNALTNQSESKIKSQSNIPLNAKSPLEATVEPKIENIKSKVSKATQTTKRKTSVRSKPTDPSVLPDKPKTRKRSKPESKATDKKI